MDECGNTVRTSATKLIRTQPAAICRENAEMYMKYEGRKTQRELMAFKPAKAEPTVATLSK